MSLGMSSAELKIWFAGWKAGYLKSCVDEQEAREALKGALDLLKIHAAEYVSAQSQPGTARDARLDRIELALAKAECSDA